MHASLYIRAVFVMVYDLTWFGAAYDGESWRNAGPNAPLDALAAVLSRAATLGAPGRDYLLLATCYLLLTTYY